MASIDSRRLTGLNLYVDGPAAVAHVTVAQGERVSWLEDWELRVEQGCHALNIPNPETFFAPYPGGAALGFTAPIDMLYGATELNEWAIKAAQHPRLSWSEVSDAIKATLAEERNPAMTGMQRAARSQGKPFLWDDDHVSVGLGKGAQTWTADTIPDPADISWSDVTRVPVAVITGTNGKTTTSRLLTRMLRHDGLRVGSTSTDGVCVDEAIVERGDWTGPGAARMVLRRNDVDAAVLEAARGGILRRGLGFEQCDVAIVTNVAADHLGEYGIDDVEAMAKVKALVYRGLKPGGIRVINGDDPLLTGYMTTEPHETILFSLNADNPLLVSHCAKGGRAWILETGSLVRVEGDDRRQVIEAHRAPLMVKGAAHHNIANGLAAAAAAEAMGVSIEAIHRALSTFGSTPLDNPGRCQAVEIDGVRLFLDFGHNPHGLEAILSMARRLLGDSQGRIAVSVGQAGDRTDPEILGLCDMLLSHGAVRVLLRNMKGYERGREEGAVAAMMRRELIGRGMEPESISVVDSETDALDAALKWAKPGDVVLLLVHLQREAVQQWLEAFQTDEIDAP